jgi:hypothetical protein
MALECAHCGTRCEDGATRCPKCLRTTHLLPVAAAPPPRSKGPVVAAILGGALLVGGAAFVLARRPSGPPPLPVHTPAAASDPLALTGDDLAPLVARARAERDAVARARLVATAVHERRAAAVASEDEPTPPPRAPSLVWRVLPTLRERVTELDLARLVAAVLRAAGDASASVAERTAPPRPDDVLDASGVRGSFVVLAGDHVVEPTQGTLVGKGTVRQRALTASALVGAVSAQAALELADAGGNAPRAIEYANASVEAWPEAPVPLAARARVWLAVGASSGLTSAEQDLRAAVSMRDDAALHLLLARVTLMRGDVANAARAAVRAATIAPGWGAPSVALLALKDVNAQLDAGAPDGCARLRGARAPWTDDAYALCSAGVADDVRAASARRLLDGTHDPLRVAFAAAALPAGAAPSLPSRVARHERRELASWLALFGRPELLAGDDGGAP